MQTKISNKIKTAPKNPGVYIFYKNRTPLYIGKASNLKNRLQNYLQITDFKTKTLHREADKLKFIKLHSNIEALIVESKMIKELKPRYNVLWRDDKNYFFVAFTRSTNSGQAKEKFPRIFITHQCLKDTYIGPFTEGQTLKAILRLLRRYFPYCTCKPHFRFCLNAQINNCPGYCCNKNAKATKNQIAQYKKNIQKIKNVLVGKDKKFIKKLKDPYELLILEKIWAHKPYLEIKERAEEKKLSRAECYDISHLSGKEAVGAMTAWKRPTTNDQRPTTWTADKSLWRTFKIRGSYTQDDPRMIEEMVSRRLNHPEWPYPNLIIIDGGITQLKAAQRALKNLKLRIISFAKPQKLVFGLEKKPIPISKLPQKWQGLIEMAINQTHNFVQRYHRRVRQKRFLDL